MIQKVIREWLGVPYTNAEADELTQELNDRTVGTDDGYNSIQELGDATQAIEVKTDLVTVTGAINLDTIATNVSTNNAKRSYPIADETKLSGIEASADVTDTANVTAAGALMDSEVTNLAQVKAFDSADYATAAQGTLADGAAQLADANTFTELNLFEQGFFAGKASAATDINLFVGNNAGTTALTQLVSGVGKLSNPNGLELDAGASEVYTDDDPITGSGIGNRDYNDARYGAIADVTANTAKISFDSTSSTRLANTSGTNTGDQDISGIATNASSITAIEAITDVAIVSDTTSAGGGTAVTNMVEITQAAYDLLTPDASTFYLING